MRRFLAHHGRRACRHDFGLAAARKERDARLRRFDAASKMGGIWVDDAGRIACAAGRCCSSYLYQPRTPPPLFGRILRRNVAAV